MNEFRVERMSRQELDLAIDCAADQGWNPGLNDADCFWAIDPNGLFMGVLDGQVIGRAAAFVYDDRFAFCGLYIVDAGHRGKGYGLAITQDRLRYIGDRNAGLDGVTAMVDRYARLGYRAAHRSIRHSFTPSSAGTQSAGIVPASTVPFGELSDYDARHFPARRERFLGKWIAQPGGLALVSVQSGRISGYGVIRPCRAGFKIGPLFADNEQIADDLFVALCGHAIGQPVSLDIPEPNRAGLALAARYGMSPEFECTRMYLRGDPGLPLANIFGLTTFEAG